MHQIRSRRYRPVRQSRRRAQVLGAQLHQIRCRRYRPVCQSRRRAQVLGVWVPHCPSKRQKVHGHVRPAREASKPAAVPVAKASSKAKALLRPSSRSRGRRAHLHHVPRPSCGFLLRYCMRCGSVRPSLRCCLRARVPPRVQGVRRPALGMHHSLELFGSALSP